MRGKTQDTLWLLFGVILIFGTMAAFSPSSTLGRAFLNFRGSIEDIFGGEVGYCPFINPYAMSIYSAGGLEITGRHPLCGPIKYAMDEVSLSSVTDETHADYETANSCDTIVYAVSIVEDTGNINITKKVIGESPVINSYANDVFFAKLNAVQQEGVDKSNSIAIQLMTEKRPAWQCFLIFGLLPFLITYYLLNDILAFAYFRTNTRRLIAIFASLIAVLTGAFANLLVAVASFVGLSLGQSFLAAIFAMAILAVLLGQITMTAGVAKSTVNAVQQVVTGSLMLSNIAKSGKQPPQQGGNP